MVYNFFYSLFLISNDNFIILKVYDTFQKIVATLIIECKIQNYSDKQEMKKV